MFGWLKRLVDGPAMELGDTSDLPNGRQRRSPTTRKRTSETIIMDHMASHATVTSNDMVLRQAFVDAGLKPNTVVPELSKLARDGKLRQRTKASRNYVYELANALAVVQSVPAPPNPMDKRISDAILQAVGKAGANGLFGKALLLSIIAGVGEVVQTPQTAPVINALLAQKLIRMGRDEYTGRHRYYDNTI